MIPLMGDTDGKVRAEAARILGDLGAAAAPATNLLVSALADPESAVRPRAARALANLGVTPRVSVPSLERALRNKRNFGLRYHAAMALGNVAIASPEVVAALQRAQIDVDPEISRVATRSLKSILARGE